MVTHAIWEKNKIRGGNVIFENTQNSTLILTTLFLRRSKTRRSVESSWEGVWWRQI